MSIPTPVLTGAITGPNMSSSGYCCVVGTICYLTSDAGTFSIIDVSNPAVPVLLGQIYDPINLNYAEGVAVSGNYAFVAVLSLFAGIWGIANPSFKVIDISNPAAPTVVATITDATHLASPENVCLVGSYAYVLNIHASGFNSIAVINIANPLAPTVANSISDNRLGGPVFSALSGDTLFITCRNSANLVSIDVTAPAAPAILDSVSIGIGATGISIGTIGGKTYAFCGATSANSVVIDDVSNPSAIVQAAPSISDAVRFNRISNADINGTTLYTSAYGSSVWAGTGSGLTTVDCSAISPTNPPTISSFVPALAGCIYDHVFLAGGYAYVTDTGSVGGLYIFNLSGGTPSPLTVGVDPSYGSAPAGQVGTPYSFPLSASGGVWPYTFEVSSGALPPGMSVNASSGTLEGTPSAGGDFTATITVTDSA